MTKAIAWIFVGFFILVGFDYLGKLTGNFFAARNFGYGGAALAEELFSGPLTLPSNGSGRGLADVDLTQFGPNGRGRAFITQGYGRTSFAAAYVNDWHDGIDIAAVYGASVHSPAAGTVLATGNQDNYCPRRGFGEYVAVETATTGTPAHILWFAHLGTINVAPGQTIGAGTIIGTVGATGFETGTHLHFSVFNADGFSMAPRHGCGPDPTGRDQNPLLYLETVAQ